MNKNYNIKLNPKEPDSKQIASHMDFDALLEKFEASKEQKPTARRRRLLYYVSGAVAAAVVGVIFMVNIFTNPRTNITEEEYFLQQAYVHPPLEVPQPQFASFDVNVNQGGV